MLLTAFSPTIGTHTGKTMPKKRGSSARTGSKKIVRLRFPEGLEHADRVHVEEIVPVFARNRPLRRVEVRLDIHERPIRSEKEFLRILDIEINPPQGLHHELFDGLGVGLA